MLITRVIPVLLLRRRSLVKSVKFRNPTYVGDPINTVRIFNEREVDEIVIFDIEASVKGTSPQLELLEEIASEAFMPFAYGGGVKSVSYAREIFKRGAEKIVINTSACEDPTLIARLSNEFGSQSIVVSIDVRKRWIGGYRVVTSQARRSTHKDPVAWAEEVQSYGAGEILLTSVERDGTFIGYDLQLTKSVASAVDIPVVACGGAGSLEHVREVVLHGKAAAAAAGSLFVFQGSHRAVLINYPKREMLDKLFIESKS